MLLCAGKVALACMEFMSWNFYLLVCDCVVLVTKLNTMEYFRTNGGNEPGKQNFK